MTTRRRFLQNASVLLIASQLAEAAEKTAPLTRKIPSTGEAIPVIGMGTSGSFEVPAGSPEHQALKEVLKRFFEGGSSVIDTAPTYGNAEDLLGPLLAEGNFRKRAFIATKLSRVNGRAEGLAQFNKSLKTLQTDKIELLQVHNLNDWKTQLALARELKSQGKVKYVGVTHYLESGQAELADVVKAGKPDFLQINYSVTQRSAEQRVFPLARDLGVAVMANRNFDDGALFSRVKGKSLPGWAEEAGITSWAQMFLKFALSHDAVTVLIPATGKPDRQSDNLQAGKGPLLSTAQREELIKLVA